MRSAPSARSCSSSATPAPPEKLSARRADARPRTSDRTPHGRRRPSLPPAPRTTPFPSRSSCRLRREALVHPAPEQRHAILRPSLVARHRAVGDPLQNLRGVILRLLVIMEIEPESEHAALILVAEQRFDVPHEAQPRRRRHSIPLSNRKALGISARFRTSYARAETCRAPPGTKHEEKSPCSHASSSSVRPHCLRSA